MMKILLVDDHAIVRLGLKQILEDEFDKAEFGEAENTAQALEQISSKKWDIVILDLSMPGRSGMEVLKEIRQSSAKVPVLILSMYPEEQYAVRVLKAGAAGYLTKESAPEALVEAVKKVIKGGKYVSPAVAEKLASEVELGAELSPHERLSDREYEVMQLIAKGKAVQEIAQTLSLSPKTIDTYRRRVLDKMGLKNNSELMQYAMKEKLVE